MANTDSQPLPSARPSRQFRENPFPHLHRLRRTMPIHRTSLGWMLTRYRDCAEVLASRRFAMHGIQEFLCAQLGAGPAFQLVSRRFHFLDPPDHTRIRSLMTTAFSARQILAMRPKIERLAAQLLGNSGARFDLIEALAYPLPSMVISEMLGTPLADRARLSAWTAPITRIQMDVRIEAGLLAEADSAAMEFMTYVRALIGERRQNPGMDLLSNLIRAEIDGDRLSSEELVAGVIFLFNAGHHTTRDFIGNALVALLRHRDQWDLIVGDPSLIPDAVEECLRYDPSITRTIRFALEDTEIAGTTIRAGEAVHCLLNAANRDPAEFPDPDRLDVFRANKNHLSFGGGIHFCLGATLARLETEVVLGLLAHRYPRLRLATDDFEWRDSSTFRGPVSLPVVVE